MKSNYENIKIELETTPELAFLFALVTNQGLKQENEITKILSEEGRADIHSLAQSIIDQVAQKTNFKYKFREN